MNQQQNILALDAAFGPVCAVFLRQDGKQFGTTSQSEKPHSQTILPLLEKLLSDAGLDWRDLQLLGIGIGPGSFTGLRVVAATMAGINAGLRLPMLKLSSLAITAWQSNIRGPVRVIEDARADSAWVGYYQDGVAVEKDRALSWDEVRSLPTCIYLSQASNGLDLSGWKHLPLERQRYEALAMMIRQQTDNVTNLDILPRFAYPDYLTPSQAEHNA